MYSEYQSVRSLPPQPAHKVYGARQAGFCVLHLANLALLRPGASEWRGRVLVKLAGGATQQAASLRLAGSGSWGYIY